MSRGKFLKIWFLSMAIAMLCSIMEVYRLQEIYPLITAPIHLFGQTLIAYGSLVSFTGFALFLVCYSVKAMEKISAVTLLVMSVVPVICLVSIGALTGLSKDFLSFSQDNADEQRSKNTNNVLLISIDTLRADCLGCYGHPTVNTPTLDRLARKGLMIEDAITSIPVTTSGHATILTGTDPPVHGSRFNAVPVSADVEILSEAFNRNGYCTGAFVSAFPVTAEVSDLHRGFNTYDQLLTPSLGHPLIYRTMLLRWLSHFGRFRAAERRWQATNDSVIKWFRKSANPWFAWVHYYDPHFPYQPKFPLEKLYLDHSPEYSQSVFEIARVNQQGIRLPPGQIAEYKSLYLSEITGVDEAVQNLLRELALQQQLENTLVLATADHGESLDEHDNFFTHGDDLFDPALRVPWITGFPGQWKRDNRVSGHIAAGQAPLKATAGFLASMTGIDFQSIDPVSQELVGIWQSRESRLSPGNSYCETGAGVYTAAHEPSADSLSRKDRALRTVTTKIISGRDGEISGFDLDEDPGEIQTIKQLNSSKYNALTAELFEYIQRVESSDGVELIPMDDEVLEKLQLLGYID